MVLVYGEPWSAASSHPAPLYEALRGPPCNDESLKRVHAELTQRIAAEQWEAVERELSEVARKLQNAGRYDAADLVRDHREQLLKRHYRKHVPEGFRRALKEGAGWLEKALIKGDKRD
jgi:pyruvate-formate lyase